MARRSARPVRWAEHDREAFWTFVRLRMAELRLSQEVVGREVGLDRSVLSRRLTGETGDRPSAQMVADLAAVLKLTPAEHARLLALAGHRQPAAGGEPDVGAIPAEHEAARPAPDRAALVRTRLLKRGGWLLLAAAAIVAAVVLIGLSAIARRPRSDDGAKDASHTPTRTATVRPLGGLWISPANGEVVHGPITFAARAYATDPDDPPVAMVVFTVSWQGLAGPWLVACRVFAPLPADRYECNWDPATAGAPAGLLRISFDVYDAATPTPHANQAPHGTRTITYAPAHP